MVNIYTQIEKTFFSAVQDHPVYFPLLVRNPVAFMKDLETKFEKLEIFVRCFMWRKTNFFISPFQKLKMRSNLKYQNL